MDARNARYKRYKLMAHRAHRCLLALGLCFLAADALACSRDDVQFYLDKGFTHKQVAALCGGDDGDGERSGGNYRAAGEAEEEAYQRGLARREREEDHHFIRAAIDGHSVRLTPTYLEYTSGLCMRVSNSPDVEARGKICPDVRFRIYLRGLVIEGYDKKFFIAGQRELIVNGKVRRKLVQDMRKYQPHVQQAIKRSFREDRNKDGTAIPILDDSSIKRVMEILRQRIADADARKPRRRK